jgi:hypothetical protein
MARVTDETVGWKWCGRHGARGMRWEARWASCFWDGWEGGVYGWGVAPAGAVTADATDGMISVVVRVK